MEPFVRRVVVYFLVGAAKNRRNGDRIGAQWCVKRARELRLRADSYECRNIYWARFELGALPGDI